MGVWRPGTSTVPVPFPVYKPFVTGEGAEKIDLVITLGGDGTILHASSLFKAGAVPPVLSFSMGTLGFLLPFRQLAPSIPTTHTDGWLNLFT